jgi:CRISPR-associated protein Csb1
MSAQFSEPSDIIKKAIEEQASKTKKDEKNNKATDTNSKEKSTGNKYEFVLWVRHLLGMKSKDKCPACNVPRIFKVAMEHDPMALLHGFQISVKDKLTFVGLRSPRAITGSIMGLNCDRIVVPGVRFDPIGTAAASQAIFQKQRISAKKIEARFCIDVGLLTSMQLGENKHAKARLELLLKIALCKVAWFIDELNNGKRLRSECDVRLVKNGAKFWINRVENGGNAFGYEAIAKAAKNGLDIACDSIGFDKKNSPLVLKHVIAKSKEETATENNDISKEDTDTETEGDSKE